jgi:signal peptide peptidase SppA
MMHPAQRFPHIAQRLFNAPLAIREEKAEIITAALAQRLGISDFTRFNGSTLAFDDDGESEVLFSGPRDSSIGYDVEIGIARIAVEGTLVHKLGTLRPWSGMTGYDGIRQNLLTALADDEVEGIFLDIDSPGGEVAGCFGLAETIFKARGNKPIWAILTESAYSAAYALASACDRIVVPATGGTGSVGVIALHVDFSKALDKAGFAVNVVKYGQHKDDCADFAPLSKDARARVQADVDKMGAMFDALVARHRKLDAAKIKSFEAATFMGQAGIAAGLADAVMEPDAALRELVRAL